jgi:hypothetical protein
LGVILNVREIAQTADGRVLAEYEAIEVQSGSSSGTSVSPYAIGGEASDSARTRIVDPRILTEAQAVAGGLSRAEYREAREASEDSGNSSSVAAPGRDLDPAEEAVVNQLRARDSAVRQEEEAHAAAAGPYGSAPQYTYQVGPDGNAYAIGGHVDVSISTSNAADRDRALGILQNAALAANAPSAADMSAFRQASLQRATSGAENTQDTIKESGGQDASNSDGTPRNISIAV